MTLIKASQNLIYSWWSGPHATREAIAPENVLFGGVTDDGRPRVFRKRPTDESYATIPNYVLYGPGDQDDHNSPSILSVAGKPLVVFWQRHNASPYLNWWKAPEGTFDFGEKFRFTFPGPVTYCQVFHIDGDRSIAFVRCHGSTSSTQGWYFITTDDHWETVSEPVKLIGGLDGTRIYITIRASSTPGVYHFAVAKNPDSTTEHYIVYGTLDFDSGDIGDGQGGVAGNLWTGAGLPLLPTDLFDIGALTGTTQKLRLLDLAEVHGEPVIEYAKWGGITSQYFQAHLPSPGVAVLDALGILTGPEFEPHHSRHYIAGTALDPDAGFLYVARKEGSVSYVERFDVLADFTLANKIVLQTNSTYRLVRPVPFVGGVMWQELRKYNSFKDYLSYIWLYEES